MLKRALSVAACAALLSGCGYLPDPAVVDSLQYRIGNLEDDRSALLLEVASLKRRISSIEQRPGARHSVALDPADSSGYDVIDTRLGPVLVILHDTSALADGSRVTLRLGNLSAGTLTGGHILVKYGSRYDASVHSAYAGWEESLHSRHQGITPPLVSGSWTLVQVPLPRVKPDQLGYMEVSVVPDQVSLARHF